MSDVLAEEIQVEVTQGAYKGRLTTGGNGLKRVWNQYDDLGRSAKAQHVIGNNSYLYQNTYGWSQPSGPNAQGAGNVLTQMTLPPVGDATSGEVVRYTYDSSGARQSITATPVGGGPQAIVNSIVRNVRGQTTQISFGNGVLQTYEYNDATDLRLSYLLTTRNSIALQQLIYEFDPNGNIESISDGLDSSQDATYSYNSLNELVGGTWTYGYDSRGNLTSKEGATQTYGSSGGFVRGPHALATANGRTYGYDANGNLISRSDGLVITWNAKNQPIQMSGGPVAAPTSKHFFETGLVKKTHTTGGASIRTYYLPHLRIENGAARVSYDNFAERHTDGTLKYHQPDHLGSATLVTNASGAVVRRMNYKPFGEDRSLAAAGSYVPPYQFTFKEKEQDGTGFYDYGARIYNPATGRWLSADTEIADGLNRYAYVRNNPLKYTDPTGNAAGDCVWDPWSRRRTPTIGRASVAQAAEMHIDEIKFQEWRQRMLDEEYDADGINWRVRAYVRVVEYANLAQGLKTLTVKTVGWGAGKLLAWRAARLAATKVDDLALIKVESKLAELAAGSEMRFFNNFFGTCNRCAIRNAAEAMELEGVKDAGVTIINYADEGASHAVAWVKLNSGEVRYLSYGKVFSKLEDIVPNVKIKSSYDLDLESHLYIFPPKSAPAWLQWWIWPN